MENKYYKTDMEPESYWINKDYRIQLNITGKCPLNCDFCYIKRNYSNHFLSLKELHKLWKNLRKYSKKYGIKYIVNLTGGDIFDHPDINNIIDFLNKEPTIKQVEPLINTFWKEEQKSILSKLNKKIKSIQFNSDVVNENDLRYAKLNKKMVALKVSFYKGEYKNKIKKLKYLISKFDNILIATDLIIPQKNSPLKKDLFVINNPEEIKKMVKKFRRIFGDKFRVTSTTVKRVLGEEIHLCPIPFGGFCVMPDGNIISCARYPHLKSGFNINNFDLNKYISKYNRLCSNFCLFENKHFCEFWKKSDNPINFTNKK